VIFFPNSTISKKKKIIKEYEIRITLKSKNQKEKPKKVKSMVYIERAAAGNYLLFVIYFSFEQYYRLLISIFHNHHKMGESKKKLFVPLIVFMYFFR
jgi:hypothetical protein